MNALDFLNALRPAIPMSVERPCTSPSNSELRRWMANGAVTLNGQKLRPADEVDAVESLVFFPSSEKRRTTVF